jgi:protein-disulfide isomerase
MSDEPGSRGPSKSSKRAPNFRPGRVIALIAIIAAIGALALAATRSGLHYADGGVSADPDRARIEQIVRDYILAHPEIIPEAVKRLHEGEAAKAVDAQRARYETPFAGAWGGAEKGDVVLVEFFDYACGFCRASNPDIARLLDEDNGLKVVWRELPVLGEDSVAAAQVSLAAAKQGRFRAFHDRLFAAGRPDPAAVAAARQAAGVTAAPSPEFQREIEQNFELARAINATGTPTFVIGDRVIQGAVGYQTLKDAIAEARDKT